MSTIGERVRQVRKDYKLSMDKFGAKINISSAAVSNIENAVTNPSKQTVSAICVRFGVNEQWLLSGDGDPYPNKSTKEELMEFVEDIISDDNETRLRFVMALSKIPPEQWQFIADFWKNFGK